ncbi:nose resistant to fluoxetine protein 6-like, partial [Stegodyphus dumicola]|uniref:nose resistant to fluoxetine protein 6-like n=1 Tax=Stegodyphus dumicola TaxID=202533 RepID=UPI0015B35437
MDLKVILAFAVIAASESLSFTNDIGEPLGNEIVYDKWHKLDKKFKEFVNYGMKMALPQIIRATSKMNLTSTCRKQGFEFAIGLRNLREWAIEFVDSTGKGIDGFLSGTLSAFGNYDGCLNAVATKSKLGGQGDVMFRGKYCVVEFRPVLPIKEKKVYSFADKIEGLMAATKTGSDLIKMIAARAHLFYTGSINIGMCIPSGCSKDDLEQFIKYFADTLYFDSKVATCEERGRKYSTFFIVSTFFYALATFLVAFATTMHLCIQHKNIIRSKTLKLLMAFSFVTSFQKLFSTKVANKSFAFLNGMRFLAMAWIVFSHTYLASLAAFPLQRNLIYVYGSFSNYFSHLMQQVITSGVLSVSTFLFIGGLLNCYSRVKELEIKKRQSNVFVYIFYRMWRIYPAYIYAIFFVMVLQTLNNGPMFSSISYDYARGCDEKWWRNILFINNLFPVGES